jgi:N-acetylmuramoyl-L-alanine amidase
MPFRQLCSACVSSFTAVNENYMRLTLQNVGIGAVAATFLAALSSPVMSGAAERAGSAGSDTLEVVTQIKPGSGLVPAAPWSVETPTDVQDVEVSNDVAAPRAAASLAALVNAQPRLTDLPRELNCLAGAVYFEAKSESLIGQLAVGRVVVARSRSGRFPNSYCGVVFQPSQFSFVRGGGMPGIDRRSRQWRNAVAIAQIAHAGTWRSPVEGALFFHATHVSPSWKRARMAKVENHVFYR